MGLSVIFAVIDKKVCQNARHEFKLYMYSCMHACIPDKVSEGSPAVQFDRDL